MDTIKQYVYDDALTRAYINRELKRLDIEKVKKLADYNGLISELSNFNESISNVASEYKEAYKKCVDVGTISSLPITDTEKLLESSQKIYELMAEVDSLILQVRELIRKYNDEYISNVAKIKNHREYKLIDVVEEIKWMK